MTSFETQMNGMQQQYLTWLADVKNANVKIANSKATQPWIRIEPAVRLHAESLVEPHDFPKTAKDFWDLQYQPEKIVDLLCFYDVYEGLDWQNGDERQYYSSFEDYVHQDPMSALLRLGEILGVNAIIIGHAVRAKKRGNSDADHSLPPSRMSKRMFRPRELAPSIKRPPSPFPTDEVMKDRYTASSALYPIDEVMEDQYTAPNTPSIDRPPSPFPINEVMKNRYIASSTLASKETILWDGRSRNRWS